MTKPSTIPVGSWPALLRDELAAAYVGERTVEEFRSRVGTVWPQPFLNFGSGKSHYRVWRKSDLDAVVHGRTKRRRSPSVL